MALLLYGVTSTLFVIVLLIAFVYFAPALALKVALETTRRQSGLVRKEITPAHGAHFVYLEGGQGVPLMLLHGFGGNKDTFVQIAGLLTKHYRVIIPDIIGFGESEHPSDAGYSLSVQVERLRKFVQALNLHHLHLGGNSMGGQIALQYAAMYSTEVYSLWLISPSGIWSAPETRVLNTIREKGHNPLIARSEEEYKKVMALGMSKPPYIPKPMLKVLAQERIDNADLEEHIFQQLLDHAVEDQIRGMKIPTLIVFGTHDRIISVETAHILEELLPDSKVVFVEDTGHVAMFEKAQQCANDYLAFRHSLNVGSEQCG